MVNAYNSTGRFCVPYNLVVYLTRVFYFLIVFQFLYNLLFLLLYFFIPLSNSEVRGQRSKVRVERSDKGQGQRSEVKN